MDNAVQSELHGIIFVYSISDGLFNARFSCSCSDVRRINMYFEREKLHRIILLLRDVAVAKCLKRFSLNSDSETDDYVFSAAASIIPALVSFSNPCKGMHVPRPPRAR